MQTSLLGIANKAKQDKKYKFHYVVDLLYIKWYHEFRFIRTGWSRHAVA